jgi:RNA polymerase sigma-70 factor (ECF subfamily)
MELQLNLVNRILAIPFEVPSKAECAPALALQVTQLFELYRNPLFRYLSTLGLPEDDAEEVIQEVFLALFRHLKAGKPQDNLRGWVFRCGHNLAVKLRLRVLNRNSGPEAFELRADPDPNPEELAVARQQQARLAAVYRALPQRERACLALRAEGFRYREIAEIQGMSLGAVAGVLSRALGKLAQVEALL